ncbi:MAG: MOSC domain-containing protein [Chloroflexi bacterium]|nr:MOSC domain-containing protein [Chloroflexota bacterium]
MADASVVLISIAPGQPGDGKPAEAVDVATAVAGKGLEGDRYFGHDHDSQVTLIEAEAIDAMANDAGLELAYGEARRNIVTRGVALNDLLGKEFTVGGVRMRGARLSEPCQHLASLTDQKVVKGLVHKGGLKAQILTDGEIRIGDSVQI